MALQAKTLVRITGILIFLWLSAVNLAMAEEGVGDSGSTGSFDINKESVTIDQAGNYTITGTGVETGNTIRVVLDSKEAVANITIKDVNIKTNVCPFDIIKGTVNLTLEGDGNVLQAGDNCAALQVSGNNVLVITEKSTGKLTATGGGKAAGIGGNPNVDAGFITIAGGTVVATGGDEAAGIGGGNMRSAGSITIKGGTVEATGRDGSAGIGGGKGSSFDFITISGGTVKARGEGIGAGIGAGKGGSITIKGGTVDATGGDYGAGIGGGYRSRDVSITISGGKVTTEGNIGDGEDSYSPAKGTISGGTIVCKSISPTLSITGGSVCTEDNSVDKNGKVMAVVKGSPKELPANTKVTSITIGGVMYEWTDVYTDENGMLYLYLQQDQPGSAILMIGEKEYTANALREYDITKGPVTITAAGDYAIVGGGTQTGNAITVELGKKEDVANITIEGVDIKTGDYVCPFSIKKGTVNLTLVGDGNVLEAELGFAALQVAENSVLVITGEETGKLTAIGGDLGAGIGGAFNNNAGHITIAGGTVVARGGDGGAGIGGGMANTAGSINISGGKVTTEGNIGAGKGSSSPAQGTISGGTIVCKSISPDLSITGGSVHTQDNSVDKDNKGMAVVKGLPKGEKVTSITISDAPYGSNDVYTDDKGQLYLYITKGGAVPVSLTIDDKVYTLHVTLEPIITISGKEVTYNESDHKDKNIRIEKDATFTIDAAEASVIDLTIEPGGKLVTTQQLEVKGGFTVERNANEQKWLTFCSPVPLNLLNQSWATGSGSSSGLYLKSGFTTANDQKWTLEQSLEKDTPYLIGVPTGVAACTLYAHNVKLLVENKIKIDQPSGFDNNLLFRANLSLTEQTITEDIYVLEDYGDKQAIVLKSNYTLKPFEAYFIASPASPTTPAIESQGEPGKMTSPELRAAPNDIIMPQKLTLKQPHSGKGSFTIKKEGQVAYGFALWGETVTLELSPKTTDGYSIDNSLIKVYETGNPTQIITLNGSGNLYTFPMPNAPVTIEVEFMKTLTIKPDEGQVVYKDEDIADYHPTYTVENRTDGDKDIVFEGNLKVVDNKGVNTIVNDNLSAGDKYKIEVKSDVTVERLTNKNAADAEATLNGSQVSNGWYTNNPVTVIPPSGFLIKQTSFSSASLSLRDAAVADGYTDMLTFADEGEHTVGYSLKRKATNAEYSGKSITYKLDTEAPTYIIKQDESDRPTEVVLRDDISGMASYSYKLDNSAEVTVSVDPISNKAIFYLYGSPGTYKLSLTMTDVAGNKNTKTIEVEFRYNNEDGGNGGGGDYEEGGNDDNNNNNNNGGDNDNNNGDNDNNGGGNGGGNDNDNNDSVANEAIQAPAYGIYVENSKLCIETSQPCQVSIYNYQGIAVMIRQIPSGKTRLYELPVGQYIVRLSAPYLPQGKVTQKVRVN